MQRLAPSLPCYKSVVDEAYRHIVTISKQGRIYAYSVYASRRQKVLA